MTTYTPYLDTRDLYTEREELRAALTDDDGNQLTPDQEDAERLAALDDLFGAIGEEAGRYGETMIPEDAFVQYAEELADDIGAFDSSASWPMCHIDWQAAANSLRMDYTEVYFDGTTYLIQL